MTIEIMDENSNVGQPKASGVTTANHSASPTAPKLATPSAIDANVPTTKPTKTATLLQNPLPNRYTATTIANVKVASSKLIGLANSGELGLPPPTQRTDTGINVIPIIVIIVPVTTGGKKRIKRLNR